jgi:hypothetical protein
MFSDPEDRPTGNDGKPHHKNRPVWASDDEATNCLSCQTTFTAFNRKVRIMISALFKFWYLLLQFSASLSVKTIYVFGNILSNLIITCFSATVA